MATTADIRNGMVIFWNNGYWKILEFQHVKMGRGGAFVRTKLKNLRTGQVVENTFRSGEKLDEVRLESRQMQYLYFDGSSYIFMDTETYEQIPISSELIEGVKVFIKENDEVNVLFHDAEPLDINLPTYVILQVVETEPGIKGDTVSGATKPAKLETGLVVQVPLFINEGDMVKIDTRAGEYIERVK
ncbi:MAG: elongation factor P [Candidatus Marinimicrobia bacterium]|nr:elongation factor P [Candidatus Neomarinimicrobiota bacterium]